MSPLDVDVRVRMSLDMVPDKMECWKPDPLKRDG